MPQIITLKVFLDKYNKVEDTSQYLTKPNDWNDIIIVSMSKKLLLQSKKSKEIEKAKITMQQSKSAATKIKYQKLIDKLIIEYNLI
jgi:hypothetical protein